jgi:adenylate cyclase
VRSRSTQDILRAARLWSGVILFVYVTTHLLNHAAGLISLNAAEMGRAVSLVIWRNWLGTALLYGALITHVALTLWGLYVRRSLRMRASEGIQTALGFAIPTLLIQHIIGTRLVSDYFGITDSYTYAMLTYWHLVPTYGVQQAVLLVIAWVHGCIGLHMWLRFKPWYPRARNGLLTGALLVPVLSLLGFNQMGHEIEFLLTQPGWLERTFASVGLPNDPAVRFYNMQLFQTRIVLLSILALAIGARLIRAWILRRRGLVRLVYPGPQMVDVVRGTSVLEASQLAGLPHASVCGGRGRCSTCRIRIGATSVDLPAPTDQEKKVLARVAAAPNVRLACQLRPAPGQIEVTPLLPPTASAREAYRRPAYLQGREDEIAILFADLRAFTKFSEHKLPFDVVFVLNRYFQAMGSAVEEAGGHLDKFIGDGVMALFGIGTSREQGCREALSAARAMSEKLDELNVSLASDLKQPLRIGIGIHAGPAIVGEMGYGRTTHVTAIGDTVNTASRLEALTKPLKAQIVVSEIVGTYAGVDLSGLASQEMKVRGRKQPLKIRYAASASEIPETGVRAERSRTRYAETASRAAH